MKIFPQPLTTKTIYRERASPVRQLVTTTRVYRRDVTSPVRIITSPARVMNIRVRPSVINREYDRIERKYRSASVSPYDSRGIADKTFASVSDEAAGYEKEVLIVFPIELQRRDP
jgi:hypothetical protein